MHVRVRHPAPVRIVPTGGRHERVVLAACETAAEIPELDASEFQDLGVSIGATRLLFRDGGIWGALPIHDEHLDGRRDSASAFSAWLADEHIDGKLPGILSNLLRRSPFSVIDPSFSGTGYETVDHVRSCPPLGPCREIRRDLRESTARAVTTRLRQDFAIVGGQAVHRWQPLVQAMYDAGYGQSGLRLATHPHSNLRGPVLADISRLNEMKDFANVGRSGLTRDLEKVVWALIGKSLRPGGRAFYANAHAGPVKDAVAEARRVHKDDGELAEFERALAPIADLALAGLVDPDVDARVLGLMFEAVDYVRPLLPRTYPGAGFLGNLSKARDRLLEPAAAPDAEDVAALSSLTI